MTKLKVYIAGPYTKGDVVANVRAAIMAGDKVFRAGYTPFIPHMNMIWHFLHPADAQQWYDWDLEWLPLCQALIRIPGDSLGADKEVIRAGELRIPVYYSVEHFLKVMR
ncbi:MAG: hypothetical protein DDT20_00929 [Firmicutes bacterium]|nr:hypothetical protein [Bacillota bacterium]